MASAYRTNITLGSVAALVALIASPLLSISPASADASPPAGTAIPESLYSITSFDSQSAPYPAPPSVDGTAKGAIDGDVNTEWTSLGTPAPHWIAVDLGSAHPLTGIQYSVKNQSNGPIKDYKVFVTSDAAVASSTSGDWGQPVATGQFTQPTSNSEQQSVSFATPVTGRYVKLEADSTINGANYAAISEISVFTTDTPAPTGTAIPSSQYTIAGFDSQSPAYPAPPSLDGTAKGAIDGDLSTEWTSLGTAMPHWLAVDLGATYNLSGLEYWVKNQSNGPVKNFKIYGTNSVTVAHSATGDWGRPIQTGTFAQSSSNTAAQAVNFSGNVSVRYLKIEADSSINGSNYAAISELSAFTTGPAVATPEYGVTVGSTGSWTHPDDTSASSFIDKDGSYYYESAHSLYGANDSRNWTFNTGTTIDTATSDAAINNAVSPTDPTDKNSDTTARCNNSPTGKTATQAPAGSGYGERNYCDLTQMWVDPDTGDWYGLVHNEFTPQPFGDGLHYDAIDYAVSKDQGKTWKILNQVITTPYSTARGDTATFPQQTYDYGDGDPRLYVDTASGYFYVYYGSRIVNKNGSWAAFYEHAARSPISAKMAPGSWTKYNEGTWSQPGLGGKESNLVPVSSTNTTGYTPAAQEYNPANPGSAAQQIAAGTMPATSPLFVMDITYNAYLGLYIGEPQNPDQSGNASQQYYAAKSLANPQWKLVGDTGSYTTA
ncbi:MAG: discoidin domain-containing protein, partial [Acidobacteria bacterium]|nr:discoidin domain-containing protein [Acidobacteriota bacterium]